MDQNPSIVVKEDLTNLEPSQGTPQVTPTPEDVAKPAPGDKTESALLLKSLQEEREKRRQLEEENEALKSSTLSEDIPSDEGKALKKLIDDQNAKIAKLEDEKQLDKVYAQFPDIKGLSSEFETYKAEFPRHKLENVAKLFLAEKGLLDTSRKGLEKSTGGTRVPLSSGMSVEDVKTLRETNFRQYQDMLRKGQIKV